MYQTAKVSKLLLAINKGKGATYKGKSLEEIEFSDNVDSDTDKEASSSKRQEEFVDEDIVGTCSDINEKVERNMGGTDTETHNRFASSKNKSENLNFTVDVDTDKNTGIGLFMFSFNLLNSIQLVRDQLNL